MDVNILHLARGGGNTALYSLGCLPVNIFFIRYFFGFEYLIDIVVHGRDLRKLAYLSKGLKIGGTAFVWISLY